MGRKGKRVHEQSEGSSAPSVDYLDAPTMHKGHRTYKWQRPLPFVSNDVV